MPEHAVAVLPRQVATTGRERTPVVFEEELHARWREDARDAVREAPSEWYVEAE
jgi:hypothetical protein